MLFVSGGFKIFDALWAFQYDDELSDDVRTVVFEGDLTVWGWVWLVVGITLIATAIAVVSGVAVGTMGRDRHRRRLGDLVLPVDLLPAAVDDPQRGARRPRHLRPRHVWRIRKVGFRPWLLSPP